MFRRRDKRSWQKIVVETFWPRGGWGRAVQYVKHRLRRLPDSPHRIARGIFSGLVASFTPFIGFHFIVAAVIARGMRGNIIAALLATFFGNPVTFPFIAWLSLRIGHWILGTEYKANAADTLGRKFSAAFNDLWHNLGALFSGAPRHWDGLIKFHHEVFLPYLIGGILPGVIAGTIAFHVSLPLIAAYQNRRRTQLRARIEAMQAAAKGAAEGS